MYSMQERMTCSLVLCYSPIWGCAGDRAVMVVNVHCGTVLGMHFQHGGKFVHQDSPTMHFDNLLAGPVRNLKVANTQLANSPWKEWRVLISVNLLSFFLVKVMPQSQKGRKIEHVSGERNVAKFNSWWGKEEAVLIFLIITFSKLATLLLLNMTLPKKKLNFNWRPGQGGTSSKLQECERGTTFQ